MAYGGIGGLGGVGGVGGVGGGGSSKSSVEELERLRNGVTQLAAASASVADSLRPLERRWLAVEERLRVLESAVDDRMRIVDERWQRHATATEEKNRQVDATLDARWKTMQRAMESKFRQMEALMEDRGKPAMQVGTEYWHQEMEHSTYPLGAYTPVGREEETQVYGVTTVTGTVPDSRRDDRLTSWGTMGGLGGIGGLSLGHATSNVLEDAGGALPLTSQLTTGGMTLASQQHPIPKATAARFSRMVAQHHTLLRDVFNEPTTPPTRSHSYLPPCVAPSTAPHPTESEATGTTTITASTTLSEDAAALLDAAKKGRAGELRQLLDSGVAVNVATTLGSTPMHLAARYGHVEVLALLLERGADANARHYMGWTPLHESAAQEHLPCVSMLMQNGSDVESRNDLGRTPLHVAAYCAREEAVRALLEAGASTTAQDDEGNTPYDLASSDTVRRLLRPPPSQIISPLSQSQSQSPPTSNAPSPPPPQTAHLKSAANSPIHSPTHSQTQSPPHTPPPMNSPGIGASPGNPSAPNAATAAGSERSG